MKAEHFAITTRDVCDAILTGLASLQYQTNPQTLVTTGCVRTIGRVESDTPDALGRGLTKGLPGILLYYRGGTYAPRGTNGLKFSDVLDIRLLCCAGNMRSKGERHAEDEIVPTSATSPGVEELQDWAVYFAIRALRGVTGICSAYPKSHTQAHEIEPGRWVGAVDLVVDRTLDCYDDSSAVVLTKLGLVANPVDDDDLWTDPLTQLLPNITDPATKQGGVTTL